MVCGRETATQAYIPPIRRRWCWVVDRNPQNDLHKKPRDVGVARRTERRIPLPALFTLRQVDFPCLWYGYVGSASLYTGGRNMSGAGAWSECGEKVLDGWGKSVILCKGINSHVIRFMLPHYQTPASESQQHPSNGNKLRKRESDYEKPHKPPHPKPHPSISIISLSSYSN